jgi:hypothetical protein
MPHPTVEVRWFFEGALPDAVRRWFEALEDAAAIDQPARTDLYVQPTGPAMNVKVREGRLEVKRREAVGPRQPLADGVQARLETWRKWGFPLQPGAAQEAADDAHWIAVRKRRWLRNYQRSETGVALVGETETPEAACQVEISEIGARGETGWSLCFEAFGATDRLESVLRATAVHVLSGDVPFTLAPEQAQGYPAWLMAHGAG